MGYLCVLNAYLTRQIRTITYRVGMSRALMQAAYLEYRVTKQCSGVGVEDTLATDGRPPGWFRLAECGYGLGNGPCLETTLQTLGQENRRRVASYLKGTGKRTLAGERERLVALAKRVGIKITKQGFVKV